MADEWREDPFVTSPSIRTTPRRSTSNRETITSLSTLDEDDFGYFGIPSASSDWPRTQHTSTGQPELVSRDDGDLGLSAGISIIKKQPESNERVLREAESRETLATATATPVITPFDGISVQDTPPDSNKNRHIFPFLKRRREDDKINLLAPSLRPSPWQNPPPPPPPSYEAAAPSRFRWHVEPWTVMYALLLFGVVGAIGHHLYYNSLNGKPADDQLLRLRYGVVLAFIAKAGLVTAVIIAFKQRIWYTM
jgi:hypothetical protein